MAFRLDRFKTVFADRDRHADTNGTHSTGGTRSTAALKGHPNTTLGRIKITANAARVQQFVRRDSTIGVRLIANGAALAKSLVYLSLFGLVSAIALMLKYLLFTLTGVIARLYPTEFDRDAVVDALNEVEKDSWLNN